MSPRRDEQSRERSVRSAEIWKAAQSDSLKLVIDEHGRLAPKLEADDAPTPGEEAPEAPGDPEPPG